MLPIFTMSLHFQTILVYFIINAIRQPQNIFWLNNYYMAMSTIELILPTIAAVVVASKIRQESEKLLSQLLEFVCETENEEAISKVTNFLPSFN